MEHRLIFIISAPRSGSTLLMRILNAVPGIQGHPELHLLPPLAHLGLWRTVEKAPFDSLQAQAAMAGIVAALPGGTRDYVAACRAYADALYGGLLAGLDADARYLIDKTPANALVLPELRRLYPEAKVIVLTRHPAAVFVSYAESFFAGDFEEAVRFNPILSRYVPAIARFVLEDDGPVLHVTYERLVGEPEAVLGEIGAFLELEIGMEALAYGAVPVAAGLGDVEAGRIGRLERREERWRSVLADSVKRRVVVEQLAGVSDAELGVWGCGVDEVAELGGGGEPGRRRGGVWRWGLVAVRKAVRRGRGRHWVGRMRDFCDVLLR
ncbi:MAG: hypothetical protein ACI8RZ_006844 [Myxococcota bacterium]|jgi:hypothetical protein